MLQRDWVQKDLVVKDLAVSLPQSVKQILLSRGYSSEQAIKDLLSASLQKLKNPKVLKDIDKAVDRLLLAFEKQEKVLVYGDFDLDGSCGLTILVEGLRDFGFKNVDYFQPKRLEDGYGFHAHLVERFKTEAVDLILTVDVGITAVEAAEACAGFGIDLIITDHHQPAEVLPKAVAVVNPNRKDCESALGHLCGAGVGFYLLLALKIAFEKRKIPHQWQVKSSFDLLLIAILTDMVPLREENRALAKHGILQLQITRRPALEYLLSQLKMWGRDLSGQDVAIGFAPKLNALSRLEQGILPVDLFLEKDPKRAREKATKAMQLNEARKNLQQEAEAIAEQLHLQNADEAFVFVYNDDFHKGVIGLVATKLMQKYQVPSFVATKIGDVLVGSARAPENYPLSLLEIFEAAKAHLDTYGGHNAAAGFQLKASAASDFHEALRGFVRKPEGIRSQIAYDTEVDLVDLNEETLRALDQLGPYGTDFPVPLFFVKNLEVHEKISMRGGHLRFTLKDNKSNKKTAVLFSPPTYANEMNTGDQVDALVELQWNYFNGRKTTQLLIRDIRKRL